MNLSYTKILLIFQLLFIFFKEKVFISWGWLITFMIVTIIIDSVTSSIGENLSKSMLKKQEAKIKKLELEIELSKQMRDNLKK